MCIVLTHYMITVFHSSPSNSKENLVLYLKLDIYRSFFHLPFFFLLFLR